MRPDLNFYELWILSLLAMLRGATDNIEIRVSDLKEAEADRSANFRRFFGEFDEKRFQGALAKLEEFGILDRIGGTLIRFTEKGYEEGKKALAHVQGREDPKFLTAEDVGLVRPEPGSPEHREALDKFTAEAQTVLEPIMLSLYVNEALGQTPTEMDKLLTAPGLEMDELDPRVVRDCIGSLSKALKSDLPPEVRPPHFVTWEKDGKTWVELTENGRRFAAKLAKYRFGTTDMVKAVRKAGFSVQERLALERQAKRAKKDARKKKRGDR